METCCEECIGHQRALSPWTDDDDDDDDDLYFTPRRLLPHCSLVPEGNCHPYLTTFVLSVCSCIMCTNCFSVSNKIHGEP